MKRAALLLFAGLFGLATLQTATAQQGGPNSGQQGGPDSGNHEVTIQVDKINDITVNGAPTIDIGQNIDTWVDGDDVDATYDVETNVNSPRKIEVSASQTGSATIENYGLKVTDGSDALSDGEAGEIVLTDVGESGFSDGTLVSGFQQVGESGLALDYEAKVNYEYNPGDQNDPNNAKVEVTYTLTSN